MKNISDEQLDRLLKQMARMDFPERQDETQDYPVDDVYWVISNTYETVYLLRNEIGRQAKNSFNVALGLIISGVFIVFGAIFLFIRNNIVGCILSSVASAVTNIIGATIMKLYKHTNDRLDKLDADLFTLNTAKVQYAIICKIDDQKKRDTELSKLIKSIGDIKSNEQTVRVA